LKNSNNDVVVYTVEAIHELPLHTVTKPFSPFTFFKKLKCYRIPNYYLLLHKGEAGGGEEKG
jgi:hypothetical protein